MNTTPLKPQQSKQQKTLRLIIIVTAIFAFFVILYQFRDYIASFFNSRSSPPFHFSGPHIGYFKPMKI